MAKTVTVNFKHRQASNTSDKRIADAYNKNTNFDVDLITSDEKKVSAHRFVLAMYSKYFANQISDIGIPNGLLIISLNTLPFEIVQKVVQLLYFREVTVPEDLSSQMKEALKFLKIDDTNVGSNDDEFKKPAPVAQTQRKMVPVQKPPNAAGPALVQQQQQLQHHLQQQPQPQQQQMKPIRLEKNVQNKTASYVPTKRLRSQSTFVSGSAHDPEFLNAQKSQIATANQNAAAMNFARNNPGLTITKMARPQPSKVSPPSTTPNSSPVTLPNVGTTMETPVKMAPQSTMSNPSLVNKQNGMQNGGASVQTPEKKNITPIVSQQQQQQQHPVQSRPPILNIPASLTIQKIEKSSVSIQKVPTPTAESVANIPASINIQKVNPIAEKSNTIQNDETIQPDENDDQFDEMETDEGQYEDDAMDDVREEEAEDGDVETEFDGDLRDILPGLRDADQ